MGEETMRLRERLAGRRTLSRDLLTGLVVLLLPIMLLRGTLEYWYFSTNMRAALEKHAEASADDMAALLQEPLYVMNHEEVRRIAAMYVDSGRLAGIRIISEAGEALIERAAPAPSVLRPRTRTVRWQGQELGRVELWFADDDFIRAKEQLVWALVLFSTVVFIFGFSLVYGFLRWALARPLAGLLRRINEMARGELAGELPPVPQQDLNQIMAAMNVMSRDLASVTSHLRESNARYQALVDSIPLGINLIDAEYRIVMSNATMSQWFTKDRDLLIGHPCYREFEKRDQVCGHCPGTISMATGGLAMTETEGVRDDGSRFAVRIRTVPLGSPEKPTGFIEVVEDVTEARRAEEEKAKVERQLLQAQKMESIGTLAGGIAHDFNNILSGIIGYTDLALLRSAEADVVRENLRQVRKAADRATELVRQILTFSRRRRQEKSPVQIAPIIREALKLLRASIPTTIEIAQDITAEGTVLADPTQIHQVVMNLCTNAYHAMLERGGKLGVSLKEITVDRILSDPGLELPPGQYVLLSVSDTGCGMDRETLSRIFEPYFTTKKNESGSGLGLAVVHGIVKDHHGRISVYSEPGQGTLFTVYLPMLVRQVSEPGEVAPAPPVSRGHERIMVVDDEAAIRDMACQFLTQAGYRVEVFGNGAEAWAAWRRTPEAWDLLYTDQTMPGMTGEQLVARVRELRPGLPVIISSGFSEILEDGRVHALGIQACLQKPVTFLTLLTAVAEALYGRAG